MNAVTLTISLPPHHPYHWNTGIVYCNCNHILSTSWTVVVLGRITATATGGGTWCPRSKRGGACGTCEQWFSSSSRSSTCSLTTTVVYVIWRCSCTWCNPTCTFSAVLVPGRPWGVGRGHASSSIQRRRRRVLPVTPSRGQHPVVARARDEPIRGPPGLLQMRDRLWILVVLVIVAHRIGGSRSRSHMHDSTRFLVRTFARLYIYKLFCSHFYLR
jgi:hypothetical protein